MGSENGAVLGLVHHFIHPLIRIYKVMAIFSQILENDLLLVLPPSKLFLTLSLSLQQRCF